MMNKPAIAAPTPIPAFAPVLNVEFDSVDACVAVGSAVPGVPGARLVDVGLKLLVQVIEPPLLVGKTYGVINVSHTSELVLKSPTTEVHGMAFPLTKQGPPPQK